MPATPDDHPNPVIQNNIKITNACNEKCMVVVAATRRHGNDIVMYGFNPEIPYVLAL